MCWQSNKFPKRHIANEDITCYKIFSKRDIVWETTLYTNIKKMIKVASLYRNYSYAPYKENPEVKLTYYRVDCITNWIINTGYHSYISLLDAKRHHCSNFNIIECVIPKNSFYYINNYGETVSSNLIVTDKIVD